MPKRIYELRIMNYKFGCCGNGKHFQKTMRYTTKCDVAVAQVSVSFFYLLTGMFRIALVEKLMPEIQFVVAVFSIQQIILKNVMASAFSLEQ